MRGKRKREAGLSTTHVEALLSIERCKAVVAHQWAKEMRDQRVFRYMAQHERLQTLSHHDWL